MPTTSNKYRLNLLDVLKGLAVASLGQPILIILTSLAAKKFDIEWSEQWQLAVSSGAAYLIKNFFTAKPAEEPKLPTTFPTQKPK